MSHKIKRLIRKSNSREAGFTLIEVLVALAILSIIAIGIYSALHSGLANTVNEEGRATARSLAEAQMEYVKNKMLDGWDFGGEEDLPSDYDPNPGIMSQYNGYEVTIDAVEVESREDLQLITVTVFRDGEEVYMLEGMKLVTDATFYWPKVEE